LTPRTPYIVGIAGATCSGKSQIARSLERKFQGTQLVIVSCDSYYYDLSALDPAERDNRNFDMPEAIEKDLLHRHLATLVAGGEISRPRYDFATHTRRDSSVHVGPVELVVVEGLFALYWKEIRRLMDTKVFVTLPENTALSRRLKRDIRERGRTRESVLSQYLHTVKPMNEKYVMPTRAFADIVVNGADPIEQSAHAILSRIESHWDR
jgi:uridine kinase